MSSKVKGCQVLVVEDEADCRKVLVEAIQSRASAVGVANGLEAITFLRCLPSLPQLVLLDLHMPVMTGSQFLEAARRDRRLADLPVVLLSGAADLTEQARALGASGYLIKPLDFRRLLTLVDRYCRNSERPSTGHYPVPVAGPARRLMSEKG